MTETKKKTRKKTTTVKKKSASTASSLKGREVFIVDGSRTPFLKAKGKPGPFAAAELALGCARPHIR